MTVTQKLELIAFIDSNKDEFVEGNELNREWFIEKVSYLFPNINQDNVVKQNMAIMGAYCTINKILHKYGLHIAARNYYNRFEILGRNAVDKKVKSYKRVANQKLNTATELSTGKRMYHSKLKRFSTKAVKRLVDSI